MAGYRTWITRDGRHIALKDMKEDHLVRTIKMLSGQLERMEAGDDSFCHPEDLEDEIDVRETWIEKMKLELVFRKNNIM